MAYPKSRLFLPWTDRAGHFSWLKLACLIVVILPGLWMAFRSTGFYPSPQPVTFLIHDTGDWSMRFLIVAMAITPLRFILRKNRLILVRRTFGLAALFYALAHVVLYCAGLEWNFGTIASEIQGALYIQVGLAATIILIALGCTSNDWSVHKLGAKWWNRIHKWSYLAIVLSLLHFLLEDRTDADEVMLLSGIFILLLGLRGMRQTRFGLNLWSILVLTIISAVAAAGIEIGYYWLMTGVDWHEILKANFGYADSIRPSWWVAMIGIATALVTLIRDKWGAGKSPSAARSVGGEARTG